MVDKCTKCTDLSMLERMTKSEDWRTYMDARFIEHMKKEEESFLSIRDMQKNMAINMASIEKEIHKAFKERDEKYTNMVSEYSKLMASKDIAHEKDMGLMRVKQSRVIASATTIVAIIAIGMKVLG